MSNNIVISGVDTVAKIKECGAYTITHDATGKQYHGSTSDLHRRLKEHRNDLIRGDHGNKALQELAGSDGSFTVTFDKATSIEEARYVEGQRIQQALPEQRLNVSLEPVNPLKNWTANPEMRERVSESRLGNANAAGQVFTEDRRMAASERMLGNTHLTGHRHTEETRQRMSEAHRGKPKSPEAIRKAALGRSTGTVSIDGVTHLSLADAARAVGMSIDGVKKRCKSNKHETWCFTPKKV
ncbi:NUMOD3 motif (2 copies) [compost metagenome]